VWDLLVLKRGGSSYRSCPKAPVRRSASAAPGVRIRLSHRDALTHDPQEGETAFRKSMPSGLTRLRGRSPFGVAKARGIMRKQHPKRAMVIQPHPIAL
jgi:hypothetical protein